MDDSTHELADLICEFLAVALEHEARERLTDEAKQIEATYEQFLAMSLTHLITRRFQLTPIEEPDVSEGPEDEADGDE